MLGKLFKKISGSTGDKKKETSGQEQFKYCPKCKVEYRKDFFTCVNCDVKLVDSLEDKNSMVEKKKIRPLSGSDKLVNFEAGSLPEIKRHKALLEKAGIASLIISENGMAAKG